MVLTSKQEAGLKIAIERYRAGEKYTVIAGFAGTGKSTLIKFIIAALNLCPEDVCYVAYTGKAAQVLKNKGCPNVMTAHKLLYEAKPMPNGTYKFEPKLSIGDFKIVVVDEISMLPKVMWDRLLTHNVYIIACGDPFQLPPIVIIMLLIIRIFFWMKLCDRPMIVRLFVSPCGFVKANQLVNSRPQVNK